MLKYNFIVELLLVRGIKGSSTEFTETALNRSDHKITYLACIRDMRCLVRMATRTPDLPRRFLQFLYANPGIALD
jgi:hypothetical protein